MNQETPVDRLCDNCKYNELTGSKCGKSEKGCSECEMCIKAEKRDHCRCIRIIAKSGPVKCPYYEEDV